MTVPVRVIKAADLIAADPTPGMDRSLAFELPVLWAGRVVTAPGMVSGWHHHDKNETSLYVVSGILRMEFDEIQARIVARALTYWADPFEKRPGEINHDDGGRGLYWLDPSGHKLEIITVPYGGWPA